MLVPMTVEFDGAEPFTVLPKSRDLAKMEQDGVALAETSPIVGSYTLVYYALRRLERAGQLPDGVEVPDSIEAFIDAADLDSIEDGDEGNGSGPAPSTGS